ncbi:bifunctional nuclease family protein [Candidatus Bipolaricaulota bacterium]|jgi:bifunctional DNase/RNase|nr:bifunctional nuclease family protein [Candidatus Bipolaricaulota bacterium]
MREVVIKALLVDPSSNSPVVLLKDRSSRKALPIWIGDSEAISIAFGLQDEEFPRPLTHVLMSQMIENLDAKVDKVIIKAVQDGTFLASIYVRDSHGDVMEFDARPSDSLALSLRAGCRIFVEDDVFQAEAIESPFAEEDEFHDFVDDDLDLGEFRKWKEWASEEDGGKQVS